MEVLLFPSLDEAERHLKLAGFGFQGASSRWRKEGADAISYADARLQGSGAVVLITDIATVSADPAL